MAKSAHLPQARRLIADSFRDTWRNKRSLVPIILIVMVPVLLLGLTMGAASSASAYGSLATLIMNVAVITTVMHLAAGTKHVKLAEAYYGGTRRFVPFVLVVLMLMAQTLPLLFGGLLYVSGSGGTVGLGLPEKLILVGMWAVIALPTFRWLARSIFALYIVQDDDVSPVAAVRASSALVRGATWRVGVRLLAATLTIFVLIIGPALVAATLPADSGLGSQLLLAGLQLLLGLVVVPFAAMYGYKLLKALQS